MDDDFLMDGINNICFISMGQVTGIPIFLHFGAGNFDDQGPMANSPKSCACDQYGHDDQCDVFNLMSGFMFYDGLTLEQSVDVWLNMTVRAGSSYALNQMAYNASWASAASTYAPNVDPIINDPVWRNSSYDFCYSEQYGYCSVMIFNSYGDSVFDKALSPSLFLVNNGSCATQFTIPDTAYASLLSTVPTPIVENYYQCVLTWSDALTNAAGIASGNVAIIVPIILFMALPLIYVWLQLTGNVAPKPEYDKSDKELALDLLALQILRIRDNRLRGMKRQGYLVNVALELVSAARHADGGVYDSDDSESDEEEGGQQISNPMRLSMTRQTSKKFSQKSESSMVDRDTIGSQVDHGNGSRKPERRLTNRQISFLTRNSNDSDDEYRSGEASEDRDLYGNMEGDRPTMSNRRSFRRDIEMSSTKHREDYVL